MEEQIQESEVKPATKRKRGPVVTKPGEINTIYKDTNLRTKLIELRTAGRTWEQCSEILTADFNTPISASQLKVIYPEELAKSITFDKGSNKIFEKHRDELTKRYERVVKITDWLLEAIEKVRDEFESSDMDDIQKYLAFIKMTPQINMTVKSVLEQLDFIRQENDRIKIEQKNYIYSPVQINQHIYSTLKMLNKQGFIRILKKLPYEDDDNRDEKEVQDD